MLMSSLDWISEIVLGNVKVPSEKTQEIIPFLEEIKRRYGVPLASVHDMGAGILAAVKEVFPGSLDFICHSVQADSLPVEEAQRFPLLCAYSLIQWVLEGKTHGEGYGFPFDRPRLEFAKRCESPKPADQQV